MIKSETIIPLAYLFAILFILFYIKKIIDDGRETVDLLGEDPFNYAGDSEEQMGWGSIWEFLTAGGKIDEYEDTGYDFPWWVETSPAFFVYRKLQ